MDGHMHRQMDGWTESWTEG